MSNSASTSAYAAYQSPPLPLTPVQRVTFIHPSPPPTAAAFSPLQHAPALRRRNNHNGNLRHPPHILSARLETTSLLRLPMPPSALWVPSPPLQSPTTSTTRPQRTNQLRIATTAGTLAAAPMAPPGLSSSRWPPRGAHKGESTADAKIGGRPMLLTRTVPATTAEALQGGLRGAGETLRMLSPPRVPEPRWLWKTCVCVEVLANRPHPSHR